MNEAIDVAPLRILVVDDEPIYREYLDQFLGHQGMSVRTAETGAEAIAIGREFRPHVLLVDWMLRSEMQGIEVAAALQAAQPELRILLMTGFSTADVVGATTRVDVEGILEKPFALGDLARAIEGAVAGRSPR
jgi:DNA-binding NarL/FixJ family response regulator